MKKFLYLLPFLFLWACKSQPKTIPPIQLSQNHKVLFLDSLTASKAIIQDEKEFFFNQVNTLDMSIQMGKNYEANISRDEILEDYKTFLKKDVLDFTKEETKFINAVFKEAYELCNKVSPNIFPPEIKLIKTHGKHYGKGAYYTRENCIIIPKDELILKNHNRFMETMFHEISHIYTRYDTDKRTELYGLIGFKPLGNRSNLVIKEALNNRILLNPDGINFAYNIDLQDPNGGSYSAVPIISASETSFVEDKPEFFQYLNFSLFKINIRHSVSVLSDAEGKTTINMDNIPDFFEQITDNTGYIIHPDEIIADNFMYIMMRGKENGLNQNFSEKGLELLKNIKAILIRE